MMQVTVATEEQFFEQINSYLNATDRLRVREAFEMARREHGDQVRKSGELFFTHPLTVAFYLSEFFLDAPALIAALLHDVAEDTYVSVENIEEAFGPEVSKLVDGVTKLKDVTKGVVNGRPLSKTEIEEATLHKLLGVMTTDVRAVIIKLFDRLHNMRTIRATPYHKQVHKAKETLSVYAPLANRLGIWQIKNELETISYSVLEEKELNALTREREALIKYQEELFPPIEKKIYDTLIDAKIHVNNIYLAPENISSLFRDCQANGGQSKQLDRTIRIVILLENWQSCYLALGHLHKLWKPVPNRFDDYIAFPRNNLYRSLHTTVVHTNGQHLKLRLRTVDMDRVSEVGVLAQWMYQGTSWFDAIEDRVSGFYANIDDNINVEPQDPFTGVKGVVEDVFDEQIQVYTPRGEVIEIARGATPIDFAYAIHTGLGNQCYAAYVNDTLHPLNKPLKNGDHVRIVKKIRAQPKRAWLDKDLGYIKTHYAMTNARRWFRKLSNEKAIYQGKALLESELQMLGLQDTPHSHVSKLFDYHQLQQFYFDIGRAELLPTVVVTRLIEEVWKKDAPTRNLDTILQTTNGEQLTVKNADNRELRRCGACAPQPPESIIGYIRKDSGVTVHTEGCHKLPIEPGFGRILKLEWGEEDQRQARLVTIRVKVFDRPGLLFEITQLMQNEGMNISYINTPPAPKGEVHLVFTLEIVLPRQYVRILHQIQALVNVSEVRTLDAHVTPNQQFQSMSLYLPE
ncbi:MAG: RelA/SpoT family protein [Chloroflexota bacterium]